jgi:hypothetical protein
VALSNQTRTGLLAAGIVGGLFLLVAIVVAVLVVVPRSGGTGGSGGGLFGVSKPGSTSEGESWTLKELVGHLRARNVLGPFTDDDTHYAQPALLNPYPRVEFTDPELRGLDRQAYGSVRLTIVRADTRDKAKDLAGSVGKASFSWGRFSLSGTPELIDKCRAALGR